MNWRPSTLDLSVKVIMSTLLTLFCREVDLALSPKARIPTRFVCLSDTYGDKNGAQPVHSDMI
jgi:hypothetical protein